jgi:hypothetical protein
VREMIERSRVHCDEEEDLMRATIVLGIDAGSCCFLPDVQDALEPMLTLQRDVSMAWDANPVTPLSEEHKKWLGVALLRMQPHQYVSCCPRVRMVYRPCSPAWPFLFCATTHLCRFCTIWIAWQWEDYPCLSDASPRTQ